MFESCSLSSPDNRSMENNEKSFQQFWSFCTQRLRQSESTLTVNSCRSLTGQDHSPDFPGSPQRSEHHIPPEIDLTPSHSRTTHKTIDIAELTDRQHAQRFLGAARNRQQKRCSKGKTNPLLFDAMHVYGDRPGTPTGCRWVRPKNQSSAGSSTN